MEAEPWWTIVSTAATAALALVIAVAFGRQWTPGWSVIVRIFGRLAPDAMCSAMDAEVRANGPSGSTNLMLASRGQVALAGKLKARHFDDEELMALMAGRDHRYLGCRDYLGRTALHYAAEHDRDVVAAEYLRRGLDPNPRGQLNETPLMLAAAKDSIAVAMVLLGVADMLLEACDVHGRKTALHLAAIRDAPRVAELLLHRGANLAATDANGRTAEEYARRKKTSVIATLQRHQAILDQCWAPEHHRHQPLPAQAQIREVLLTVLVPGTLPSLPMELWLAVLRHFTGRELMQHHIQEQRDAATQWAAA